MSLRDATISNLYFILLQDHSTWFGCHLHPSSGVHKTVVTATGTSHMFVHLPHSTMAKLGLIWRCWSEVAAWTYDLYQWLWTTVLCTPEDGCARHLKHLEWYCSKIEYRLHIVASHWTFINIDLQCTEPWTKNLSYFNYLITKIFWILWSHFNLSDQDSKILHMFLQM